MENSAQFADMPDYRARRSVAISTQYSPRRYVPISVSLFALVVLTAYKKLVLRISGRAKAWSVSRPPNHVSREQVIFLLFLDFAILPSEMSRSRS